LQIRAYDWGDKQKCMILLHANSETQQELPLISLMPGAQIKLIATLYLTAEAQIAAQQN